MLKMRDQAECPRYNGAPKRLTFSLFDISLFSSRHIYFNIAAAVCVSQAKGTRRRFLAAARRRVRLSARMRGCDINNAQLANMLRATRKLGSVARRVQELVT